MKLVSWVNSIIDCLQRENRKGTVKNYRTALRKAVEFSGTDVTLATVYTREWLSLYEKWLLRKGHAYNTISSYMRVLQSCYNRAVEQEVVKSTPKLFSKVFTGCAPTAKRSLSIRTLSKIRQADFSKNEKLDFCRDIFILSFYLHGITFVDLAYLKKGDLRNGVIIYRRKKSGSLITVPVSQKAEAIIRKYAPLTKDSSYLFPILCEKDKDEREQYESALRKQNRRLKLIAATLDIKENLTTYVARHSWATTAYHAKVSTSVISQAMGHSSEMVTKIYLQSFEYEELKKASDVVEKAINKYSKENKEENVRHCEKGGQS